MPTKNDDSIKCPECDAIIPLTETLQNQLSQKVKMEFKAEFEEKLKKEKEASALREADIKNKAKEFIQKQKEDAEAKAKKKAEELVSVQMKNLEEENKEKEKTLEASRKSELQSMKKIRELEENQKNMDIEVMRKVEAERKIIESSVTNRIDDENRMKALDLLLEKDKQINDMRKQIDDLKRKAEQGSQQTQGEVFELELESTLKSSFPYDEIVPVAKGTSGADIQQKVKSNTGRDCGSIIWELKQTKAWSDGWVTKLKDDQRKIKSEIAVIVTKQLPASIKSFGPYNGVWVTNFECALALSSALRSGLIETSTAKQSLVGKNEKMEVIYDYLCGTQFKQRVEAIVETFVGMKRDLDREKVAMTKMWGTREKQIERVVVNTGGMYGDLQGLVGTSLPTITALELSASEDENEEE